MAVIRVEREVRAPAARLFEKALALEQLAGYPEWNPAFARGLRVIEETGGAGTVFEVRLEAPGAVGRAVIAAYDPPHLLAAEMTGGIFRSVEVRFAVMPIGADCRLTLTMVYRLRYQPLAALIDVMMLRGKMRASAVAQLEAMKQRAEFFVRLAA